jgi:hypothetical protein|tara:strand:- start:164 stop:322 length:159 start_codon:yes stop_codon:yes gene_type:complete
VARGSGITSLTSQRDRFKAKLKTAPGLPPQCKVANWKLQKLRKLLDQDAARS